MRVLLMNQFFWPSDMATSQLLTDLARDMAAQGHVVEVIASGSGMDVAAAGHAPAVTIHRVGGLRFSRGTAGRILSYLSFYAGAAWRALTVKKPDVVLTLTTPPLLSLIGALVKHMRGCRFLIWEMDVYPDVAVDLGYIRKGSLLEKLTGALADWSRRQADGVIALGECMRARLMARGMDGARIAVVDNWADSSEIRVQPRTSTSAALQIVYSGNLGLAHDVNTIVEAMQQLRNDPRFHFIFAGGGARRPEIAALAGAEGTGTVEMRGSVPREELQNLLALGDIGLVTQREDCCGSVVPSKVYGLLAAGRPVLFIGPAAATPAKIVRDHACGWQIACGDTTNLVALLHRLAENPGDVVSAGKNARRALEEYFDRHIGTQRIIRLLEGKTLSAPFTEPEFISNQKPSSIKV